MATRTMNALKIDSSSRKSGSQTRLLAEQIVQKLLKENRIEKVVERDVAEGLPFVDEDWINANFTPEEERALEQREKLGLSDHLVQEVFDADILVIGVPVYNFGIPAALKAWIDLIARARKTFKYTDNGPVGLLAGKKAILVLASGGTAIGSEIDFATSYMKHVLGFIGIHDVEIISAGQIMIHGEEAIAKAQNQIETLDIAA